MLSEFKLHLKNPNTVRLTQSMQTPLWHVPLPVHSRLNGIPSGVCGGAAASE